MSPPVVIATNGFGVAVTEAANGLGTPVTVAINGLGTPVVYVSKGGAPVVTAGAPPLLSSSGADTLGSDSVQIFVSTDQGTGTLYAVLTEVNGLPSAAQVKAGQDSTGSIVNSRDQSVVNPGSKLFVFEGLTPSASYYGYFMHENVAGLQSLVAETDATTGPPE